MSSSKPSNPLTTLSVVSTLTPSSNPPLSLPPLHSTPPSFFSSLLSPPLRSLLSSLSRHLSSLLLPQNSSLVTAVALLYLLRKLYLLSTRSHHSPLLPLPIDHQMFPQYIVNKQSLWLYTHTWTVREPRAYVFICPAYREHSLRYESVARAFNQFGYAVFSLDHQGHGQSQGERGYVSDICRPHGGVGGGG